MAKQSQITFTIDRNKRHQVQIENIAVDKDGEVTGNVLFKKEYEQALDVVKYILEMQKSARNSEENNGVKSESAGCSMHAKVNKNNILLFTGQRGSGKTSAVTSIGRYLERNQVNEVRFKCLPMIDPSFFDNSNSILKSVLMTMFRVAKCANQASSRGGNSTNFTELWKRFDKAFKVLGDIEREKIHDYSLETLNELGEASSLRDTMQDLLNEFISMVPDKCDYLVLMIDDLDMNVSCAAQMLEQMRKFLMLDKLIILVAANLDQLQNEMREFYSKSFQQTLKDSNQTLSVDVEDLATRYLLKVFPASRRIHLSNVTNYLTETDLHIIDESITPEEFRVKYGEYDGKRLQQVILTMIWERTRLLFVPKNTSLLHPIIPSNLRVLSQFVNFLLDMKKVDCNPTEGKLFKDLANYSLCQHNFTKFKNYILNNWISENLTYEEVALFESTPHDVSEINKHFINAINVIGTKNKKRLMSREVDLEQIAKNAEGINIDRDIYTMVSPNDPRFVKANKISDIFNQPSNYSYGDLLLMIDKYETYFESDEARRFINAVKIYYSIILFETMFFKSVDVKYDFLNWEKVKVDTIIPIQRLLGGTVYYPNYFEIIASMFFKQKGPSFDAKRAFYHKFSFIYQIQEILEESDRKSASRKLKFKELITNNIHILFFILYYGDLRPDRYDQKHIYDTTHHEDADVEGIKYATFDMLSLLNNALNPLQTIRRVYADLQANTVYKLNKQLFDDYFEKLVVWGNLCQIRNDNQCVTFANSILPFYSVDMMLIYLRKTYNDTEIIQSDNNKDNYFLFQKKMVSLIGKLSKYVRDGSVFEDGKIDDLFTYYNLRQPMMIKAILTCSIDVLQKLYGLKNELLKQDINKTGALAQVNYYKDIAISQVFSHQYLTEKEKKLIVKDIHSLQTVSEIYKYLSVALLNEIVMELVVKRFIQEQIRKKTSIYNYYDKLWELTDKAIERICLDELTEPNEVSEVQSVYYRLYQTGVNVFIDVK